MIAAFAVGSGFLLGGIGGYLVGYCFGNKACNDWWNQYGAQIWGPEGSGSSADAQHAEPVSAKADPHQ